MSLNTMNDTDRDTTAQESGSTVSDNDILNKDTSEPIASSNENTVSDSSELLNSKNASDGNKTSDDKHDADGIHAFDDASEPDTIGYQNEVDQEKLYSHRPDELPQNPSVDDDALDALFADAKIVTQAGDTADDTDLEDDDDDEAEREYNHLPPEEQGTMSLTGHLSELRIRITRMLIGSFIGFLLCYGVAEDLFHYLSLPLVEVMPEGTKFIYTGVPEGFFVYLKVALVAGIFIASPYIFYQFWAFIAPGLYKEERQHIIPLAFASAIFFIAGALFCYFGVFPFAFKFFMGYTTDLIAAMPSLNEYLGFSLKLLIAFGLVFEMPLFTYFLSRLGIVSADFMRAKRGYAVIGVFVVAAILTPPDVFSQLLMSGPMLLLYEISIYIAAVFGKKRKKKTAEKSSALDESDENESEQEDRADSTASPDNLWIESRDKPLPQGESDNAASVLPSDSSSDQTPTPAPLKE